MVDKLKMYLRVLKGNANYVVNVLCDMEMQ